MINNLSKKTNKKNLKGGDEEIPNESNTTILNIEDISSALGKSDDDISSILILLIKIIINPKNLYEYLSTYEKNKSKSDKIYIELDDSILNKIKEMIDNTKTGLKDELLKLYFNLIDIKKTSTMNTSAYTLIVNEIFEQILKFKPSSVATFHNKDDSVDTILTFRDDKQVNSDMKIVYYKNNNLEKIEYITGGGVDKTDYFKDGNLVTNDVKDEFEKKYSKLLGGAKKAAKKSTKKNSKKSTKKNSKKTTKKSTKTAKKSSKKSSKKTSMKKSKLMVGGAKKSSKKNSKKVSKTVKSSAKKSTKKSTKKM